MLRRFFGRKPESPLAGAPAAPRLKSYASQSGYVYNYFYVGCRDAFRGHAGGTQFVFRVSATRSDYKDTSVFLMSSAVEAWERARGHPLTRTERYAAAKMALFQAFDERAGPAQLDAEIVVRPADLAAILQTLGLE